jgi:hypothetical protein
MGTRSYIGVECEDGIRAIYCHWDGYPEHNGRILQEHYTDFLKVCTLINNGDLSSLRENIEPTAEHTFDTPQDNVCVYYGRDRGEEGCEFRMFPHVADFTEGARESWAEYAYLFQNGQWITFKI